MQYRIFALAFVLCSPLWLSGCNKTEKVESPTAEVSADEQMMREISAGPLKQFSKTADDTHDIALLLDYDQRFTAMTDETEDELIRLHDAGTLDEKFAHDRKRDNVQSALNMLKELDLKTAQGRYIQGFMYAYWDNQAKVYDEKKRAKNGELKNPNDTIKGLGQFIHAQEQLEHWQSEYPEFKSPALKTE